jgi:hypothetical protein
LMRFHHFPLELTPCLWTMVPKESMHEQIMKMIYGSRKKLKKNECKFLSQQIELKFIIYNFME